MCISMASEVLWIEEGLGAVGAWMRKLGVALLYMTTEIAVSYVTESCVARRISLEVAIAIEGFSTAFDVADISTR